MKLKTHNYIKKESNWKKCTWICIQILQCTHSECHHVVLKFWGTQKIAIWWCVEHEHASQTENVNKEQTLFIIVKINLHD